MPSTKRTMTVKVPDYAHEESTPDRPVIRTVTIRNVCPLCRRRRGAVLHDPRKGWDFWQNPCGHVDLYPKVIEEADHYAANLADGRHATRKKGVIRNPKGNVDNLLKGAPEKPGVALRAVTIRVRDPETFAKLQKYLATFPDREKSEGYGLLVSKALADMEF